MLPSITECRRLLKDHQSTDEEILAIRDALDPIARLAVASFIKEKRLRKSPTLSSTSNAKK